MNILQRSYDLFCFAGALFAHNLAEDPNEDDVFNREEVVTPKDIDVHGAGGLGGDEGEADRSHDPLLLHDLPERGGEEAGEGIPLRDMVSTS